MLVDLFLFLRFVNKRSPSRFGQPLLGPDKETYIDRVDFFVSKELQVCVRLPGR